MPDGAADPCGLLCGPSPGAPPPACCINLRAAAASAASMNPSWFVSRLSKKPAICGLFLSAAGLPLAHPEDEAGVDLPRDRAGCANQLRSSAR